MTGRMVAAVATVLAGAALSVAGCGTTEYPNPGGEQLTITARDFRFDPPTATVHPGQVTVTLVNAGGVEHSFTADSVHTSADADPGESNVAPFVAPDSGTIAFHCRWHPQMRGTLTVVPAPRSSPTAQTGH